MSTLQSVTAALEAVASWRADEDSKRQAQIVEVDSQVEKLLAQLTQLQEQVASLQALRAELDSADVDHQVAARSQEAILGALLSQSNALRTRAAEVHAAEEARRAQVIATMHNTELSTLVEDYRKFKETVEPTLSALPESYRGAIISHHQGISEQIRAYLAKQIQGPAEVDAPAFAFDVVYCIDWSDGQPLLSGVVPVPDDTLESWADRPEDLATLISARVAQAVFEACKAEGLEGIQIGHGQWDGVLAMEVELTGAARSIEDTLASSFKTVFGAAPELVAAQVSLAARQVEVDYLLGPETDEEEE